MKHTVLPRFVWARAAGALLLITALFLGVFQVALAAPDRYVAPGGSDGTNDCTNPAAPCETIQHAISQAVAGDVIHVAAGIYDATVNIEGVVAGLSIIGENRDTVILRPSVPAALLCWNVEAYACTRTTILRVVNSSNVVVSGVTIDAALVGGDGKSIGLVADSTNVVIQNNIFKNNQTAGYYELGLAIRAPSFTDAARANVAVQDNLFIDTGRVGMNIHRYVTMDISGNTIYKTADDFGYAIELGSQAGGAITGNVIYGYDTPAASDGSESAGIYIEAAFTTGISGVQKNVTIADNEIYDCQWGMYIGNDYPNYAGDVDIHVTATGNYIHDNVDGGVMLTDEDASLGSSLTYSGSGNILKDNGAVGYSVFSDGNGSITADLTGEVITGQDVGVKMEDLDATPPTGSLYDVEIHNSRISGNTTFGVQNLISGVVANAENNWWGCSTGPGTAGCDATGAPGAVDSDPFLTAWNVWVDAATGSDTTGTGAVDAPFKTIQKGVDEVSSGGVVSVANGTYEEQVEITKPLTINGSGLGTVILSPATLTKSFATPGNTNKPVVFIHDTTGVTLSNLVVNGAGRGNANYRFIGIAFWNAGGVIDTVQVLDIRDTPFSGAQHGVGIYAYNQDATARSIEIGDSVVTGFQKTAIALIGTGLTVDVHGNTITGAGPTTVTAQNGIQVNSATGEVTGNTITGIAYTGGSWAASAMLFQAGATIDASGNTVTNSQVGVYSYQAGGSFENNSLNGGNNPNAYGVIEIGNTAAPADFVVSGNEISGFVDGIYTGEGIQNLQIIDNFIHDNSGLGFGYDDLVLGVVEVQGNLFQNNGGAGVENASAGVLNVKYNSWGHYDGPAAGDGVINVLEADYTPWTHAAVSMVSSGTLSANKVTTGEQIVYTVQMDARQMYGAEFDLSFDTTLLEVVSIVNSAALSQEAGCTLTDAGTANTSGVIHFCGRSQTMVEGQNVALYTITFLGQVAGESTLPLDGSDDGFVMLPPYGASTNIFAAALTDGALEVVNDFAVTGRLDLQGRPNDSSSGMHFEAGAAEGFGPYDAAANYWGALSFPSIAQDSYLITTNVPGYLDITAALNKTVNIVGARVLATLTLLGGDVNNDNQIGLGDATVMGSNYGQTGPNEADVNNDGSVNLLDLVMMSGNYGLNSAAAYATWTP